jgi:hypothetical protein
VSEAQLAALRSGEVDGGEFNEVERAVIRFIDDGLEGRIDDSQFAWLREALGEEAMVDLALCLGWWGGLVPLVNGALGVER